MKAIRALTDDILYILYRGGCRLKKIFWGCLWLCKDGRLSPMLPLATDTPTKNQHSNPQANLSVYTHAPKTHTNTKQQDGISVHPFNGKYVYH